MVLQKDPRYLLEILNKINLQAFRIQKTAAAQFMTDFKSPEEITAFLTKVQELEIQKKAAVQKKPSSQKEYYLGRRIGTPIAILLGIFLFPYAIFLGISQLQARAEPWGFALIMVSLIIIITAIGVYAPFFGSGLKQTLERRGDYLSRSLAVYENLLNLLISRGNVAYLKQFNLQGLKVNPIEILATFSTQGRGKLNWWNKRASKSRGGFYGLPTDIIHYIPSIDLLIRPTSESIPTELQEWQLDLFRGMMYIDNRIDIPRFTKLAQISHRYFLRALYSIVASGTVKFEIKEGSITFQDEDQVNAVISQLQREFQQWSTPASV